LYRYVRKIVEKACPTLREGGFHVKRTYLIAIAIAMVALFASWLLVQARDRDQQAAAPANADEKEKALRAKRIAAQFERDARVLTVFDRQGKVVTTVGERAIYRDPVFSPDRTRLAVTKIDLETETEDLWVLEMTTGNSTRITSNRTEDQERVGGVPVWSPDANQVAYGALRGGYWGLYRKASNGAGTEELLYQHPGGVMALRDWSMDGRFLSFSTTDLSGGTLYALPLAGEGERRPIEVFRTESQVEGSGLSPDSRFLSYASDQSGKNEVYVRPFDPSAGAGATLAAGPWQVSDQGGEGAALWRRDGEELYYLAADRGVMVVKVSTAPRVEFGKPTLLFRLSEAVTVNPRRASVSRDGQRVVIAVPHAPVLQQITVFDRQGTVLSKVGEPGRYVQPAFSPDGTRVAVMRTDPREGDVDIWTFDVATGKGTPITNDTLPENAPIWSPDGSQVAYGSTRGTFSSIYRKAWDGTGNEERLFQYTPGAFLVLTDWSADGKFLTFHDGCSGVLHVLPLGGDRKPLEREAMEWLRDEYNVAQARFSPDGRFIAYLSNEFKTSEEIESEIFEVYVRPFDASKADVSAGGVKAVQVSTAGAQGMIVWRQDGKELYYLTPDWEVMAVDVTTTPAFQAGTPRFLFKLPGSLVGNPQQWRNVSRDGQRFVFTMNVPVSVSAR
jgi:Tol biopolymer transport system component